jgi:serine/threonine-protein kinase
VDLPLARAPVIAPGLKLDRYEILARLAEGGMASVWIARQTGGYGFEKLVAIKTILPKFVADAWFQKMFIQETRIASRIEHANVTRILDVGEQDNVTYLVMEYVDGDSLATLHRAVQKKGMLIPAGIVLRVMADVCEGLHTAHELRDDEGSLLRVVHRDVSPQNVLVSTRGTAKLIDFGIAKARDGAGANTTITGPLRGKARYMSPEQASGAVVDRRADIWGVGAVLYYLLTGKPPYASENDVQTLTMLRSGKEHDPLPSDMHPAVSALIHKALQVTPDDRFPMATDLQRAIENAMFESDLEVNHAEVAAFIAEHGAPGAQKRKTAIAQGLKAAAERQASPPADPTPTAPVPPTSDVARSSSSPGPIELPASLGSRRGVFVLASAAGAIVGIAGVLLMARGSSSRKGDVPAGSALSSVAPSTSAVENKVDPGTPSAAAAAPTVSAEIDVTDLPKATSTASAPSQPVRLPPGATNVSTRPSSSKPPPRRRIDDGF